MSFIKPMGYSMADATTPKVLRSASPSFRAVSSDSPPSSEDAVGAEFSTGSKQSSQTLTGSVPQPRSGTGRVLDEQS